MQINVLYLIVGISCFVLGLVMGAMYGRWRGRHDVLRSALKVKNPEMWDLLHHYVVDEEETQQIRKQDVRSTRKMRARQ